ncbi:alpha/beta hydrolase [Chitinophaga sp. Mgbs1]|uniref:Alpha/beta hydrolase n=1 Tax=Chitinophaga solisilvae TaxID=1233460 RepID=A0A433WN81_9BACT|nr:alpha/beta hydrolase [Chitinophaga solisilvae]
MSGILPGNRNLLQLDNITQPPALVIRGKHDAFYRVAEAPCYKRDMPDAEIHILEADHKLPESHFEEVAPLILDFLNRKIVSGYHPA